MSNVRRLTTCTAIVLAGMLASCSEDDVNEGNDPVVPESNTVSLKLISGAEQAGRVKCVAETKAFTKKEKLALVGTILPVEEKADYQWSATAVAFNETGTRAYVTWHSDKQIKNEDKAAKEWGGAVDVFDVEGAKPILKVTALEEKTLKFNHVLYDNATLFLASTSATDGGVVGRIALTEDELSGAEVKAECIGFPGSTVNAVAKYDNGLVAISGHAGTYGTFETNVEAQPYHYENKNNIEAKENVVKILGEYKENFGGKYVTTDEVDGKVYVLYNTENATITEVGNPDVTVTLNVKLASADRAAETYDPVTGEWIVSEKMHDYYGKHVFAVRNGIAYVACGKNGLVVYDIKNNKPICTEKHRTIGVCVDSEYIYAATEIGLQIYDLEYSKDQLHRYAFEVDKYNEDGTPNSEVSPTTGTDERHSPNFVAVNPKTGHIFVAYGQSGVRVYKFRSEEEEKQPEVTE